MGFFNIFSRGNSVNIYANKETKQEFDKYVSEHKGRSFKELGKEFIAAHGDKFFAKNAADVSKAEHPETVIKLKFLSEAEFARQFGGVVGTTIEYTTLRGHTAGESIGATRTIKQMQARYPEARPLTESPEAKATQELTKVRDKLGRLESQLDRTDSGKQGSLQAQIRDLRAQEKKLEETLQGFQVWGGSGWESKGEQAHAASSTVTVAGHTFAGASTVRERHSLPDEPRVAIMKQQEQLRHEIRGLNVQIKNNEREKPRNWKKANAALTNHIKAKEAEIQQLAQEETAILRGQRQKFQSSGTGRSVAVSAQGVAELGATSKAAATGTTKADKAYKAAAQKLRQEWDSALHRHFNALCDLCSAVTGIPRPLDQTGPISKKSWPDQIKAKGLDMDRVAELADNPVALREEVQRAYKKTTSWWSRVRGGNKRVEVALKSYLTSTAEIQRLEGRQTELASQSSSKATFMDRKRFLEGNIKMMRSPLGTTAPREPDEDSLSSTSTVLSSNATSDTGSISSEGSIRGRTLKELQREARGLLVDIGAIITDTEKAGKTDKEFARLLKTEHNLDLNALSTYADAHVLATDLRHLYAQRRLGQSSTGEFESKLTRLIEISDEIRRLGE